MRERLVTALKRLWPQYKWTPVDVGRERIYRCDTESGFVIMVEWSNATTTVTLSRNFGGELDATAVGASTGMTAEGVRRAYLEASVGWRLLVAPPPPPAVTVLQETATEIESDQQFFRRFFGGLK